MTRGPTLRAQLAALHAHRVATWDPAALQVNIDQRAALVERAKHAAFVQAGDTVADFQVPEVDGATLSLGTLLASGPLVLVFFRFAGCPACNIALPYYRDQLAPGLRELGATLLALSPQVPERLVEIKRRHQLDFLVASDPDNALGRRFGILYSYDEPSRRAALAQGRPIGEVTGTGTWELPMPTAIVIDPRRVVRFADVSPDWLARTEAEDILAAVRALARSSGVAA
ncbi:peroxiredoxin-like family protein [Inquilinus limosus]|uniref:thioredoxin-dependent peroxiredoxin n=1 Tax=Inquilinus limosus TaxID=171674 RepID=A0A211ZV82_9PROT|nr:peroxiredoxin-like family protein [Inquilinus limosus]OWJ69175.1 alkyl hydroperoxide reductase [Inquilinus limosus]